MRPRIETLLSARPPSKRRSRRLETGIRHAGARRDAARRRASGSITMLLGSSGSGKTVFGMQFLAEGLKRGERGCSLASSSIPRRFSRSVSASGSTASRKASNADLAVMWHRPIEGVIDEIGESLFDTVRTMGPHRVFIDGMHGFERAADFPERMSHVCSAIGQELQRLASPPSTRWRRASSSSRDIHVPINGLSASTQNIILLRHIEHRAAIRRLMVIFKVRDDDYDGRMREMLITDEGLAAGYLRRRVARGLRWRRLDGASATRTGERPLTIPRSILIVEDESDSPRCFVNC